MSWQRSAWLEALERQLRGISLRERRLLYAAVLITPFLAIVHFGVGALEQQQVQLQEQIARQHTATDALRTRMQQLATAEDPRERLDERTRHARTESAELERRLDASARDLLGPDRTAELLQRLLAGRATLELESLNRHAPEVVASGEQSPVRIDNHRIELELRGPYLDTLAYLRHLESVPVVWLWGPFELEVEEYPVNRVFLSLDALEIRGLEQTP
ncbi:MAG: hypothetical protein ACQETK_06870 [Pseudomonadota bacterium]